MKILVCTDGSEESVKAINQSIQIAKNDSSAEITLIYVYEPKLSFPVWGEGLSVSTEDLAQLKRIDEQEKENKELLLSSAVEKIRNENISVNALLKVGHPAEIIAEEALNEGYDMVVIGSRGLGGLKKYLLGSVSNAVVQQVKTSVLVVK